jgi:hypothetical protein
MDAQKIIDSISKRPDSKKYIQEIGVDFECLKDLSVGQVRKIHKSYKNFYNWQDRRVNRKK